MQHDGAMRICVGAITFRRPNLLGGLLRSFENLRAPPNATLIFLIVDNDAAMSAAIAVKNFQSRLKEGIVLYTVEARAGIPIARNRAVQEAIAAGADYLAFADDDEEVHPDWVCELVAAAVERKLDLVGGPVRCLSSDISMDLWSKALMTGIVARDMKKERSARRRAEKGLESNIVIVTNNWLVDLAWLRQTNLKFDEALRFSGGSDAKFYADARALSVRSGWSTSAVVYERVPLSRIGFGYQFDRARNQAIASFRRRHAVNTPRVMLTTLLSSAVKVLGCAACVAGVPIFGGRALIQVARQSGWAVGRMQALFGGTSSLYSTTDGD